MTENPFNRTLDWTVKGKYARVTDEDDRVFKGWVERIHHGRGSVVMHDVTTGDGEQLGSVFVRLPGTIEVLKPRRQIEWRALDELSPHPDHNGAFTPSDTVIRRCYRNQYAGSFPVVRENGTIINGHKRVAAARIAGLTHHPVEVVTVTDDQAHELFIIAHRTQANQEQTAHESTDNEQDSDTDS